MLQCLCFSPLSFPQPLPLLTTVWEKRVCVSNAVIRIRPSFRQPPAHQWGWELILDTKLGHFYHGLSSIYNLKAWPEASIAGLFIGVLLGSGEKAPLCPFQLLHATTCEDSTVARDLYPPEEQRHSSTQAFTAGVATFIWHLKVLCRVCQDRAYLYPSWWSCSRCSFSTCSTCCLPFMPSGEITRRRILE